MQDDQEQAPARQSARLRSKPASKLWQAPNPLGCWGGKRQGAGRPVGAKDSGGSRKKRNSNARTTTHLNLQHHHSGEAAAAYEQRKAALGAVQHPHKKQAHGQKLARLVEQLRQHDPADLAAALQELRPLVEESIAAAQAGSRDAKEGAGERRERAGPALLHGVPVTAATVTWAVAAAALARNGWSPLDGAADGAAPPDARQQVAAQAEAVPAAGAAGRIAGD